MKTTLNQIKDKRRHFEGLDKLLKHLNKTESDDAELSILTILASNGLDDAQWCLQTVEGKDKEIRLYAIWCVKQVQHLIKNKKIIAALNVAERFANDLATIEELTIAEDLARKSVIISSINFIDLDYVVAELLTTLKDGKCDSTTSEVWASANYASCKVSVREAANYASCEALGADGVWFAENNAAILTQTNKLIEICTK